MEDSGGGAIGALGGLFCLAIGLVVLIGIYKVFTKAGQPGWACIIPIYNLVIMLKIAGKPIWWIILMLIPFVNFIIAILVCISVAKSFGKGAGFGIGMVILPFIFLPLLGFSDAQYIGPQA